MKILRPKISLLVVAALLSWHLIFPTSSIPATWSFTTVSDTYGGLEGGLDASLVSAFANNSDIKFIVATGDFENLSTIDSNIQSNLKQYFPGQTYVPWFTAIGNHNAENSSRMSWISGTLGPRLATQLSGMTNFKEGPYNSSNFWEGRYTTYSFDYQNAHFIIWNEYYGDSASHINSGIPMACVLDSTYNWMAQDLAANTQPLIFVFVHEPAFVHESSSNHCGDSLDEDQCPGNMAAPPDDWKAYRPKRDQYWALLRQYNVVAHFDGHIHEPSQRAVKGWSDFPTAGCIDTDWNCYCSVEGEVPQISNGANLTSANGVIEFNNGLTDEYGPVNIIRVDGNKVTFLVYDRNSSSGALTLSKQFTYTASGSPADTTPPAPPTGVRVR